MNVFENNCKAISPKSCMESTLAMILYKMVIGTLYNVQIDKKTHTQVLVRLMCNSDLKKS